MENLEDPIAIAQTKWDARSFYTFGLQDIDNKANEIKVMIESREATVAEMPQLFKTYFAKLRSLFRELYFFFTEDEKKSIQDNIIRIRSVIDNLNETSMLSQGFPTDTEDEMERLHNMLNERRFQRGLIVPMGVAPDSSGVAGWESPGG